MKRLFIDMDQVIVNDDGDVPGAIEGICEILDFTSCDIFVIPSTSPSISEFCEKLEWINKYLPELTMNFIAPAIMDKMVDADDMLITHAEHDFPGIVVDFSEDKHNWEWIINIIDNAVDINLP